MSTTDQQPQQKNAKIKSDHHENDPRFNCRFTLSRDLAPIVLEVQAELGKVLTRRPSIPMTLRYMIHQISNLEARSPSMRALMEVERLTDSIFHAQVRKNIPGLPAVTEISS